MSEAMSFLVATSIFLGIVALMLVPFLIGGFLARRLRMPDHGWKIGLVLWSLTVGSVVVGTGWPPKLGIDLKGGAILVYEVDQKKKQDPDKTLSSEEMNKLIAAINRRVNPGGVKEVSIRKFGVEQIEIIIPEVGTDEARRIEKLISRAGTLEFRVLADRFNDKALIDQAAGESGKFVRDVEGEVVGQWVEIQQGDKPQDQERIARLKRNEDTAKRTVKRGKREVTEILVVQDTFDVTGAFLVRAQPDIDQKGQPCVTFMFNTMGGKLFGGLTGNNLPDIAQDRYRLLGIILDGYLYSAPQINSTITTRGEISGTFTNEEASDLVSVLNAGSLPSALAEEPIRKEQTGPTLGQDTIDKGRIAILMSISLVLVFMLFYYRFAGVVACGALLLNLLLILAVMIAIKAAFTLPGLAGLVLTIGMAVDANVLIFERIREELNRGAALRMAIRNGFARATTTIVDANLTTLITATVLYIIGRDQIKGFAVVLWLGVVLSMFTAIFCSRVVFDIAERRRWITGIRMRRLLGGTSIDFLGMRRMAAITSIVVIVAGLAGVFSRGAGLLDIDFTGGVSVQVVFKEDQPQEVAEIRKALEKLEDLTVSDVKVGAEPKGKRFRINTSNRDLDQVQEIVHDAFGDKLATNAVEIGELGLIESIAPAPSEAETTEPETTDQSRHDLPDDSMLAFAGDASGMLLAQAEPAEEETPAEETPAEETSTEETRTEEAPAEETPAEEAPAEESETPEQPAVDPLAGGTAAQLTFDEPISFDALTEILIAEFGAEAAVPTFEASSPEDGYEDEDGRSYSTWDLRIKLPPDQAGPRLESIKTRIADTPFFPALSQIGAKVAGSTQTRAVAALVASLLCIVGYIWIRFQHVVFGLAAVVALVHDVLVTLGMIALSFYVADPLEFLLIEPFKIGLPALAAFLTIIGYSLNDTIVVFDRIREVRGKSPQLTEEMVNTSINQTLSRTLLTSVTTLIVVLILYILGGQGIIHGFAFALVVGVMVGTYSSIFVASPVLVWMSRQR